MKRRGGTRLGDRRSIRIIRRRIRTVRILCTCRNVHAHACLEGQYVLFVGRRIRLCAYVYWICTCTRQRRYFTAVVYPPLRGGYRQLCRSTRHSNRFRHSVAVFRFYQTRLRPPELRFGVQTRHFLLEWHRRVTASLAGKACQRACLVKVKTATASATQDCCHVIGTVSECL